MSVDNQLGDLANLAGVQVEWIDAYGQSRVLANTTIEQVLGCLGLPNRRDSFELLRSRAAVMPTFMTTDVGGVVTLPPWPNGAKCVVLHDETGATQTRSIGEKRQFKAPLAAGYYEMDMDGRRTTLAVAPLRCFGIADATGTAHAQAWGLTAQIYALADPDRGGLGTSHAVAQLASRIGGAGGDALCLSPLHAMSPIVRDYSPYSPSHRGFLNWMHTDPARLLGVDALHAALDEAGLSGVWREAEQLPLIDWPRNYATRASVWRVLHRMLKDSAVLQKKFQIFRRDGHGSLRTHALFEARQAWAMQCGESVSWRDWPIEWRERGHATSGFFASSHADDVEFAMFLQWAAAHAWEHTSACAKRAMRIGLIADVAVGFDPGGSEAWRNRSLLLQNMTLGAPPDAFNAKGQGWGVTSYAPAALRDAGYQPFLELLRANMKLGGGIRLDHVLGLSRLWVVPDGEASSQGAYLDYPLHDLLRLVALESWRHRCIVIGEDLGTVDPELRAKLAARGILGTDVLLFNKGKSGDFLPPQNWRAQAVATTTTHDLPPLASWRCNGDIESAKSRTLRSADESAADVTARASDVGKLAVAFRASGEKDGDDSPAAFNAAALRYVARSASSLVLVPVEDALGLTLQPNVPGTVDEYPNWRQRLPENDEQELDRSMRIIARARKRGVSGA